MPLAAAVPIASARPSPSSRPTRDGLKAVPYVRKALLLRRRAAALGGHLLDLVDAVVDDDVDEILADLLGRLGRIAGDAVVDARRRIRVRRSASTAATAAGCRRGLTCGNRRLPRHPRVTRRLPLLRGLAGRIERHGLVERTHPGA